MEWIATLLQIARDAGMTPQSILIGIFAGGFGFGIGFAVGYWRRQPQIDDLKVEVHQLRDEVSVARGESKSARSEVAEARSEVRELRARLEQLLTLRAGASMAPGLRVGGDLVNQTVSGGSNLGDRTANSHNVTGQQAGPFDLPMGDGDTR